MESEQQQNIEDSLFLNAKRGQLEYQLDVSDILTRMIHTFRGEAQTIEYKENEHGEVIAVPKWVKISKPLMNEEGINAVIGEVSSLLHKNTFLSNISERSIRTVCYDKHMILAQLLAQKSKDFDLDDRDKERVLYMVMDNIYLALKRAQNGGERESLTTIRRIIEQMSSSAKENKKRLPSIFPIGRED